MQRLLLTTLFLLACDGGGGSGSGGAADATGSSDARGVEDAAPTPDATGTSDGSPPADGARPADGDVAADAGAVPPDDGVPPDMALPEPPPLNTRMPLSPRPDPLARSNVESCETFETARCVGGARQVCRVYDTSSGAFVEPDPLLARVLRFERFFERGHQPDGMTAQRRFNRATPPGTPEEEWLDPARFEGYDGVGDSAIWTGVALDARALRYSVTGTTADRARLERKVRDLLALFDVTGIEGYLARFHWLEVPEGSPTTPEHVVTHREPYHADYDFDPARLENPPAPYLAPGARPRWHGNPSIDQYTGPMVAFPMAWACSTTRT